MDRFCPRSLAIVRSSLNSCYCTINEVVKFPLPPAAGRVPETQYDLSDSVQSAHDLRSPLLRYRNIDKKRNYSESSTLVRPHPLPQPTGIQSAETDHPTPIREGKAVSCPGVYLTGVTIRETNQLQDRSRSRIGRWFPDGAVRKWCISTKDFLFPLPELSLNITI